MTSRSVLHAEAFDRVGILLSTGFKGGEPVKVVSERLGHATPMITMSVYQHVLPGMQREAAARLAATVSGHDSPFLSREVSKRYREAPTRWRANSRRLLTCGFAVRILCPRGDTDAWYTRRVDNRVDGRSRLS